MSTPTWTELVVLMVDSHDEPTLRGAIRSFDGEDVSRRSHTSFWTEGTPLPVHARHGASAAEPYKVWRDGLRVRLERPDGTPSLIVGDELCWQFHLDGRIVESPVSALRYGGQGTDLLWHQAGERLFGPYARRPLGPVEATTFLGRPAWTVEVGPPPGKDFRSEWVVDADSGFLLRDHNLTMGSVDEWVELVTGEVLSAELFSWAGPVTTDQELRESQAGDHEQEMAERRQWFTSHVAALPLRLELASSVILHQWDDTGAFEASIGEHGFGSLARRPRSNDEWQLRWSQPGHRWSDQHWDWAIQLHEDQLTVEGLEAVKRQLGSPG